VRACRTTLRSRVYVRSELRQGFFEYLSIGFEPKSMQVAFLRSAPARKFFSTWIE